MNEKPGKYVVVQFYPHWGVLYVYDGTTERIRTGDIWDKRSARRVARELNRQGTRPAGK